MALERFTVVNRLQVAFEDKIDSGQLHRQRARDVLSDVVRPLRLWPGDDVVVALVIHRADTDSVWPTVKADSAQKMCQLWRRVVQRVDDPRPLQHRVAVKCRGFWRPLVVGRLSQWSSGYFDADDSTSLR